jgi:hypothetical protein
MIDFRISPQFERDGFLNIHSGYKLGETVINHPKFASEILNLKDLTYTKEHPLDVWEKFFEFYNKDFIINVTPYWYRSKSVLGYSDGRDNIFVNKNFNGSILDYLGNCAHEFAHAIGYGHGSNFPNGWRARLMGDFADKRYSVPYQFEQIALKVWRELDS